MRSVCVFCGSSAGGRPEYAASACALGRVLAQGGRRLVYGGASVGLMGEVANAALEAGGEVVGVIPRALVRKEVVHDGLSELRVVDSMHTRKGMMADLSDAFVVLPGGLGTLEEMFEVWTWAQLGIHGKPIGLLDSGDYWKPLSVFLDHAVAEGFIRQAHRGMLRTTTDPAELVSQLAEMVGSLPAQPPTLSPDET